MSALSDSRTQISRLTIWLRFLFKRILPPLVWSRASKLNADQSMSLLGSVSLRNSYPSTLCTMSKIGMIQKEPLTGPVFAPPSLPSKKQANFRTAIIAMITSTNRSKSPYPTRNYKSGRRFSKI